MAVKNQVQLITYPDSLGGDLKTLNQVLTTYFPNTFKGGIHILPPFPSSGDRGLEQLTYLEILNTLIYSLPLIKYGVIQNQCKKIYLKCFYVELLHTLLLQ